MACDPGGVILLDFADKACQNSWKLTDAAVMACAWWGPGAGQPASWKTKKKLPDSIYEQQQTALKWGDGLAFTLDAAVTKGAKRDDS